jgi:NADH-quinone oxidoreductase subunit G
MPGPAPSLSGPTHYPIQDFYLTNPIARASPTMQRCSAEILHGRDFAEAAE